MATRFYYNPGPTLPSTALRLADIRNATGTAARVILTATNQLSIQNSAGSPVTTFAHTLAPNTWYRIEVAVSVSSTVATINAAYYPLDSTTPVDPAFSTTSGNTGTANLTQVLIGSASNATWTGRVTSTTWLCNPRRPRSSASTSHLGRRHPVAPTAVNAVPGDGQATVRGPLPDPTAGVRSPATQ